MANNGLLPWDGNNVPMQGIGQRGGIAPLNTNAAALTANTVYVYQWSPAGQQVNHVMLQNNSSVNINFELDNTVSAGSPVITPGQTIFLDVQHITLQLLSSGTPNVNGTSAGNLVVRGWL